MSIWRLGERVMINEAVMNSLFLLGFYNVYDCEGCILTDANDEFL